MSSGRIFNDQIATSYTASSSTAELAMWASTVFRASFQVSVSSGSLNGTFTLQGSNDMATGKFPSQFAPTNWNNVGGSTSVICSTTVLGVGSFMFGPVETSYEYLRLNFSAGNANAALGLYSVRFKGFTS